MKLKDASDMCTRVLRQGRSRLAIDPKEAERVAELAMRMMIVLAWARKVTVLARPIATGEPDTASQAVQRHRDMFPQFVAANLDFEEWLGDQ